MNTPECTIAFTIELWPKLSKLGPKIMRTFFILMSGPSVYVSITIQKRNQMVRLKQVTLKNIFFLVNLKVKEASFLDKFLMF